MDDNPWSPEDKGSWKPPLRESPWFRLVMATVAIGSLFLLINVGLTYFFPDEFVNELSTSVSEDVRKLLIIREAAIWGLATVLLLVVIGIARLVAGAKSKKRR